MEEMQQITIDEWMRWKEDIREKLRETAGNFVYIGFRLKQIRDSGMYGGAEDIFDFAMKEYGLSKSTVSRFMAINEKFSEGGNSLELKEEYRTIGSSKLAEMLTLTDAECSLITEKTTVSQIRELKNFSRQVPEAGEDEESRAWTPLQKCIIEFFRGKKELLDAVMRYIEEDDCKKAAEIISPNGSTTFKKGIIFLFMYDYETGVKYKTFGIKDVTVLSWNDFLLEICEIFRPDYGMGINGYDTFYKESEKEEKKVEEKPEILNGKGSVATSQQGEKGGRKDVEEMADDETPEDGDKEDGGEAEERPDENKPEDDENGTGGEDGNGNLEDDEGREKKEQDAEGQAEGHAPGRIKEEQIRGWRAGIKAAIMIMSDKYEKQDWPGIIKKAEDIIWRAEQIQKAQTEE